MGAVRTREEVAQLYHRHGDMVYQICLMLMKNVPDAEDATQTVFRKAMEHEGLFRDPEHEKAWLIRCTIHRSVSLLTAAHRRHDLPLETAAALEVEEDDRTVYAAVLALPQKYRTAIHLYYYEGYSIKEISKLLQIPLPTVGTRLSRGRERLRQLLKEDVE